jgi:signal recognition particle subunit SRP54
MFETLSENFKHAWSKLLGKSKISENDLTETLQLVKKSLLDADVALDAINNFIEAIKSKYLNLSIDKHLTAEQFLIKVVQQELINLMGEHTAINLKSSQPAVILMVGLQGSGKTTTAAKLAKYIQDKHKKTVMLASCDIYRPAAILQLQQVASQVGAEFFSYDNQASDNKNNVTNIAKAALDTAKKKFKDVLIIDTAGRLHIDVEMMQEAKQLHAVLNPIETLFVVDGMTGQDAANTAKQFNDALTITGVILTKLDGDTRGGAALSVRHITNKPIKFYTVGEKLDALEVFYPDRIASRILGMGDVLSLIEEIETKINKTEAEKIAKKVIQGQFNFSILKDQLLQMKNMGGLTNLIDKIPGLSSISANIKTKINEKINDNQIKIMIALIDSMTKKERIFPDLLNKSSRKSRICKGSGTSIQDLNKLIKHFQQMEKMSKKLSNKDNLMKMMQSLSDKLPPEFMR